MKHRTNPAAHRAAPHSPRSLAFGLRPRPMARALQTLCFGTLASLVAGSSLAPQQAWAQSANAARQPGQELRRFDIPAGPLEATLNRLGRDAGVLITFASAATEGRRSAGVTGSYSVDEALTRALARTGLGAIPAAGGGYALRTLPAVAPAGVAATRPATALPEVRVTAQADRESAWGPTSGYLAKRGSTATKTDANVHEVSQSISVITRDRMDDQGVRTLNDAIQYTAGVRSNTAGANPADDSMSMRGFSQFSSAFYLDGLRLMPLGMFGFYGVEPYGAERVEVLKGPASVLYGQNSPGGIINLVSKSPTAEAVKQVELSLGSYGRKQGAFDFAGPLRADGTLQYRLVGLVREADHQIDYMNDSRTYLAPSLTWAPSARTNVTLRAYYQKNRAMQSTKAPWNALNGSNPNGRLPLTRFLGEPGFDYETTEVATLGYEARHELDSGWTLKQSFRYLRVNNHEQYMFRYGPLIDNASSNREIDSRDGKGRAYTLDTSLSGRFTTAGLRHEFIAGLDYNRSNTSFYSYIADGPMLDIYKPRYGSVIDTSLLKPDALRNERNQQLGLYVQDRIQYDRWVLTLGGRRDWNRLEQTSLMQPSPRTTSRNPRAFTRRAGLTYLADNGLAPYASYTESFLPVSGADRAGRPFEPETGRQVEVGVKYAPNEQSAITLAAFELHRQNVVTTDPTDKRYSIQQGEVRSRGIELEAVTQATKQLRLVASLTYNPLLITKDNTDPWGGNYQGKSPFEVPKKLASAWVDYGFDGELRGLSLDAGVRYVGPSWGDAENSFSVPAFTLLDAALRYDLGAVRSAWRGLSVSVTAKNLLDKYHVASCFSSNACSYGEKRNVVLRVGYIW
ncbi:TonB-dependent siderophore receptor [Janthinobacterium fluminis]|uniref:TonB-dependent siderophore receptor n=1 Tax=Janthinobacterium fluminis TaxID=2987524 RepID=A0ABT5JW36_9BURK|nr:TonB-dependent siderophore receptor [Janthinobacterium fluminis]MDC8756950.1 TonB-dependent siderophore receptor [Janthinobacterium fluminis]